MKDVDEKTKKAGPTNTKKCEIMQNLQVYWFEAVQQSVNFVDLQAVISPAFY